MRATRRAVLLGALVATTGATTSACTGDDGRSARPAPVDPDVALRADAVARERSLLAAYDALLAAEPDRAERLAPLRAEHAAHLAALDPAPTTSTASPAAATTPPAVAALVQAERAAATAHAAATVPASPALAALLAQLAASEASHPVALA